MAITTSWRRNNNTLATKMKRISAQREMFNQQYRVPGRYNDRQLEAKNVLYIGLTANNLKERYRNHVKSMRNERYRAETELSKYVWELKDRNCPFRISWSRWTMIFLQQLFVLITCYACL